MPSNPLEPAPLVSPTQTVIEDWIDYNGHLNMAFYNVIFDRAVDHFYDLLGVGAQYAGSGAGSCFTMEIHVHYLNEVSLDDELELHLQLLELLLSLELHPIFLLTVLINLMLLQQSN